jgi:hypothetical protein
MRDSLTLAIEECIAEAVSAELPLRFKAFMEWSWDRSRWDRHR